jgi:hypothetical protein
VDFDCVDAISNRRVIILTQMIRLLMRC